jgi:S-adenosylmethionine:diacylglycerol 3-amino-3-carboxypropyl transferase
MLIQDVIGQFRCKDRSTAQLAQFYDLRRQMLAGELTLPAELERDINDLARHNKRLVRFRLATVPERQQLGSVEPVLLMDPSSELNNVLALVRHVRATAERPPSKMDTRRFVG